MHGAEQLTGVALIAVLASVIGLGMARVRQPAIVGYILTGVLLGPSALGLVEDREAIAFLADLGVILLLYFIGMELSLRSFRLIWKGAVLVAIAQITLGLIAMLPPYFIFDWSPSWLILGGFCLAISSTAVAFNILEDTQTTKTRPGRIAIGILIAQDLAVAPMLLILNGLPSASDAGVDSYSAIGEGLPILLFELGITITLLVLVIIFLSKSKRIDLFFFRQAEQRKDLLPLIALAACFGIATLAGLIGLSPAFGAFMAGLIVGNSRQRDIMRHSAEPIQVVLLMVFFLSVGLLLDLGYVWNNLGLIIFSWLLVLIFKTGCNLFLVKITGANWSDSLTVALVIGQMGEFSFVMAATALGAGVIDSDLHRFIVALCVLSLITSPLYVQIVRRNRHRAIRHIDGLKALFKLVFFKERRFSRSLGKTALVEGKRAASWAKQKGKNKQEISKEDAEQSTES